ncbi:MAG: HEAT repeat domain-containing protein, partial [Bacteroidetes bacterium]|nr:HEAT repeat domain-containing protein [Bacteroidota bacterium]
RRNATSVSTALTVLDNPFFDKRMKLTAINYLAKYNTKPVVKCLRKTLRTEVDSGVKQKAMRALGRIGDITALPELQAQTGKVASRARTMIAYKNGLQEHYVPMVATKAFTKRTRHDEVRLSALSTKESKELTIALMRDSKSKDLYTRPLQKLECGNNKFVLAGNVTKDKLFGTQELNQPSIPLQVLVTNDCPNTVSMAYSVLLHPVPGTNELQINLVSMRGDIHYTGVMRPNGKEWSFNLATAKDAILPAIKAEGSFNEVSGDLAFKEFMSATQLVVEAQKTPKKTRIKK